MQAGLAHHGTILCLNADGRGKSGEVGGVQRNLAPSVDECCAAIRDLVTDYMQHQTPDVLMVQEFHWVGKSQDKLLDSLPGGDDSWGIYRHHHTDRRQQKNVPLLIFNKGT